MRDTGETERAKEHELSLHNLMDFTSIRVQGRVKPPSTPQKKKKTALRVWIYK